MLTYEQALKDLQDYSKTIITLEKNLDKKYMEVAMLRAALEAAQWGFNHARCPVCAGFDGETERDHVHNETCIIGNALAYGKPADTDVSWPYGQCNESE